jgi:heme/copper-type cytochrome/quinol oxidase subunit 2
MNQLRHKGMIAAACAAAVVLGGSFLRSSPVGAQGTAREFSIDADQFKFAPVRLEVQKDDLVKIAFTARDIPHSFTIDQYRIAKRAAAGQTVVFEFRADQVGTHRFYCNLTTDDRCRKMEGVLVVR